MPPTPSDRDRKLDELAGPRYLEASVGRVRGDWRTFVMALLAAVLAGGSFTVELLDGNDDRIPDGARIIVQEAAPDTEAPVPASVGVDGPDLDAKPDTALALDAEARQVVRNATATPERFDLAGDLRGDDSTPVGRPPGPLATPRFPGCTTRILPTNYSSRGGAAVRAIGLHYTAGGNRAGLSDMNGLTGYASSPVAGVSWHFLIDAEGNCYYSVPLGSKAWTIGNLNPQTVNIEVVGTGRESSYPASAAGARKLGAVVRRLGRIFDVPMRVGAVSGCRVTRPGIIAHWQGGPCSGGHVDIRPYALERVVGRIAAGESGPPRTARARRRCAVLRYHRRKVERGASWSDTVTVGGRQMSRGRRAGDVRRALERGNVRHRRYCA